MLTNLKGTVDRITFYNPENGYTIARLQVSGEKQPVTVVGHVPGIMAGEILEVEGEWVSHPRHGDQLKIARYRTVIPATAEGVEKYLGSGLIKGIGPEMARRIIRRFGAAALDIIDKEPGKLAAVRGIGPGRIDMIRQGWTSHRDIKDLLIFLHGHGISPVHATRIYRRYGEKAMEVVSKDPYRLAMDITGIGFITADTMARKLGAGTDSPLRARAGVIYILRQTANEGHVYYPYQDLLDRCRDELAIETETAGKGVAACLTEKRIVIEDLNRGEAILPNLKAVYLAGYHHAETGIADALDRLRSHGKAGRPIDPEKALRWAEGQMDIVLNDEQKEAVRLALTEKILLITGGPGTGKTTLIRTMMTIFNRAGAAACLAAPTGRAAKRMEETTGCEAKTIHRLLAYSPGAGGFQKNGDQPLEADVIILDEVSMVDTVLFYHLLKALARHTVIILIGDINQLPPVGAGNVLADIMASDRFPVVTLKKVFRQQEASLIITNAHRVNAGLMPQFRDADAGRLGDFYFIRQENPEGILNTVVELVSDRVPARFGFDPLTDIQVLVPMNRGMIGTQHLNKVLQQALNAEGRPITSGGHAFKLHDKVMQIRNNYEKDVFNGDIGRITAVKEDLHEIRVAFPDKTVAFDRMELDDLTLAYAVTVHKSQGSEYTAVIIPLHMQHYMMLQRNLLYTGITRGRKLVIIVGSRRALNRAVQNNETVKRYTGLAERLSGLPGGPPG
jgi:exodeoxyribonuclease V alpha subunit